ncbi:DUF3800 domain-containing protein [Gardnerella vaginalis]|uniref:DUF3800 domain-containing protein n=1 Tax=Gardnerella vaginalis TaxID=2702 RepID=UPI0003529D3A|nr:DUF3800 domain-containing protein [Gardnerella vaginalis]EPI56390.1 hypothetical protein HMPREF1572_00826 [Gardnerella vaginalis JCP7275]
MQILFLDESGTAPKCNAVEQNPYFVLGGLVIPESQWKSLQSNLHGLKKKYGIEGEVKWRYFINHPLSNKTTPLSNLSVNELNELREDLFKLISENENFKIIAAVVNTKDYYDKYKAGNAENMYHTAFEKICERFQYYLQDLSKNAGTKVYGMIVIDARNSKQNKQLDDFHFDLLNNHDSYRADYNNLIEGLFIAASHHSVGVQFADLVAGAVYRKCSKGDSTFYNMIRNNVRRNSQGKAEGFGVVAVPSGSRIIEN